MAVDALVVTTAIAVLLFVGIICSWVGSRLKIPDVLLLILTGMFFGQIEYQNEPLVQFPEVFLSSLAILALALIVFDSTARLRLRDLDAFSLKAVKLTFISTVFTLIFFTAAAHYLLAIPVWSSLIFAALMTGTAPSVVLFFEGKSPAITLLKMESIFNTPLTIILPFLFLDLMQNIKGAFLSDVIEQLIPFVMKFIVGLGAGVFVGVILFKIVQRAYTEVYSPLAVIIAALLSYVLAENLGGSGVLACTALGLFFGNVYVKEKVALLGIESVMAKALYILVFMLLGIVIQIPYTKEFFITSGILFGVYTAIRFAATWLSVGDGKYPTSEKIYMALCSPKGVATAAVVFMLAVQNIEGMSVILDMTFAFIVYSIVLSSVVTWIRNVTHENSTRRH